MFCLIDYESASQVYTLASIHHRRRCGSIANPVLQVIMYGKFFYLWSRLVFHPEGYTSNNITFPYFRTLPYTLNKLYYLQFSLNTARHFGGNLFCSN